MAQTRPETPAAPEDLVFEWWESLAERLGDRAALQRAATPTEVVLQPAYHDLRQRLVGSGWESWLSQACMACVLSHVREDAPDYRFAEQLAAPKRPGGGAAMSGLRFRRLLQNTERDSLYLPLLRAVRLLGNRANVRDLARSIQYWGERTRRDWAFAYYENAPSGEA